MLEDSHFKRKLKQIDELNNLWAQGAEVGFQDFGKNFIDIDHSTNLEISPNDDINMQAVIICASTRASLAGRADFPRKLHRKYFHIYKKCLISKTRIKFT